MLVVSVVWCERCRWTAVNLTHTDANSSSSSSTALSPCTAARRLSSSDGVNISVILLLVGIIASRIGT